MRLSRALSLAALSVLPAAASEITPADLTALPAADVVVLGEVHDNRVHHDNQAAAVAALAPRALVFEMLTPAQAAGATGAARASPETLERALGWAGTGWPDFAWYYPIFAAAPQAAIFGGGVPRDEARRVFNEGAAAVFGAGAERFGLDAALPEAEQAAREAEQMRAHCDALPEAMLPGMVVAQRLRDAVLARATLQALEATGGPVAVITGNGHARTDRGLAAALARAAPEVTLIAVGQFEETPEPDAPFDFWLVTEPAERDDPCADFATR